MLLKTSFLFMYPISCLSVHLLSLKQLMTNVTTLKKNLQAADK